MNETETATSGTEQSTTFLQQRGIRKRMQCSGQVAHQIEEAFVTAEQLVEAVESDQDLTEHDGIGTKTAQIIRDWWNNRFEREEQISSGSVERTGAKTATIHFHNSWSDAIGDRSVETEMSDTDGVGDDG